MKATFRQSMTWLHTWTGLLLGWVLFAIFLTGTATYFRWEITRWMMPEVHRSAGPLEAARSAVRHLDQAAALSPQWFIELPDERVPATVAVWQIPGPDRHFETEVLDAASGEKVAARDTRGGEFFYRFHFQLQLPYPWGRYLAGVAAMFMFIALISGIVAHRQFFADFFTFRAGRPGLRTWLDFHNVTAVLALPFYLMITYSALVIFTALYLPWSRRVLETPEAGRPAAARSASAPASTVAPEWITPASLAPMLDAVERAWGADRQTIKRIAVADRGTERCEVTFTRATGPHVSLAAVESLRFNGVTGAPLDPPPTAHGFGAATRDTLYGLHLARFAGPGLRAGFFLMGLFGTALIGTGLIMWTLKRRPQQAGARLGFGHGLVERLNITTIAGLPVACAALFWSNRLLPVGLTDRGDWEVRTFLIVWGLALLHPLVRSVPTAWREQLWLGAALFLSLPIVDVLTTGAHLIAGLRLGEWTQVGVDASLFAVGCALLFAARRSTRRGQRPTPQAASPLAAAKSEIAV